MSTNNRGSQQPGPGWGQQPTNPYSAPAAPRRPDVRPLYKRKRVWIGGVAIFAAGAIGGGGGNSSDAVAVPRPEPTVTVHDTMTVTASPEPAPTVIKTVTATPKPRVTVTKTVKAAGSGSGGSTSGGSSSGGGGSVYYQNCDAARAAGAAPVYRGDPGYAAHLDRDGDGVGCE